MKNCIWSWSLAGLFVCSSLLAADPVVILRDDGTYVLQPNSTTLVKVTVIDQRTGTTPQPPGPNPPPNPPPTSLQQQVSEWAKQVDHPQGRAVLGEAYRLIGTQIQAGAIPTDTASVDKALTQFLDQSLDLVQGRTQWAGFRIKVADELSKRIIANGGTMTKDQWASFFGDVSAGLKAANADYAMPDWLLQIIQALLPILLQLLTRLFGG